MAKFLVILIGLFFAACYAADYVTDGGYSCKDTYLLFIGVLFFLILIYLVYICRNIKEQIDILKEKVDSLQFEENLQDGSPIPNAFSEVTGDANCSGGQLHNLDDKDKARDKLNESREQKIELLDKLLNVVSLAISSVPEGIGSKEKIRQLIFSQIDKSMAGQIDYSSLNVKSYTHDGSEILSFGELIGINYSKIDLKYYIFIAPNQTNYAIHMREWFDGNKRNGSTFITLVPATATLFNSKIQMEKRGAIG